MNAELHARVSAIKSEVVDLRRKAAAPNATADLVNQINYLEDLLEQKFRLESQ